MTPTERTDTMTTTTADGIIREVRAPATANNADRGDRDYAEWAYWCHLLGLTMTSEDGAAA